MVNVLKPLGNLQVNLRMWLSYPEQKTYRSMGYQICDQSQISRVSIDEHLMASGFVTYLELVDQGCRTILLGKVSKLGRVTIGLASEHILCGFNGTLS